MPGRADDEAAAGRGFAFTTGTLITLFAAALITRVADGGRGESAFRVDAPTWVWPVTWQFYTHPAHREFVVAYHFDEESRTFQLLIRPIADAEYRWGLGHSVYADVARWNAVIGAIPSNAWRSCTATEMSACSEVIAAAPKTTVVSRSPLVSGPVVFAVERPAGSHESRSRQVIRVAVVDLVHSG